MATLSRKFCALRRRSFGHCCRVSNSATTILAIGTMLFLAPQVAAQAPQQQYVFGSVPTSANTSVVAGFSKDSQTGSLTVLGSPINERMEGGFLAIDGLGKFLFVLNPTSNNISMFQINQTTGALTEVQKSPFAAVPSSNLNPAPTSPNYLATEKSGQFLFVGYKFGNISGQGAVNTFRIDANNLQLVQVVSTDIRSSPVGLLTDPKGLWLYVGLGPNPTTGFQDSGTLVFSIDPLTGNLTPNGSAGGQSETGRCIGMDPQGRFFFDGRGFLGGFIDSGLISPVDGTSAPASTIALAVGDFPAGLLAESSGKFLYVSQGGGVFAYSVNQTTGVLTLIPGGPLALNFTTGTAVADPMGPYIYALTSNAVQGFQVDPATGSLTKITTASSGGQGVLGVTISGQPVQAASGPVAVLFPSAFDFGAATVGQSSNTQTVHLVNSGNQLLSVNKIAMTGTNASEFVATPAASCTLLQPNTNCAISLVFTPAAIGLRRASLSATDNAPGSPQSMPISGTGVPSTSALTFVPGSLSFPATTQGTAGVPRSIRVTNSGTANLNIFSVVLGGANPNDFALTNDCIGTHAVNAGCTITVTFAPLAPGGRTATVILTDDAPGTTQTLALSGNATPAFTVTASASGSTSATVTAGHTAQFNLQITPGAGFSGSVSLACAGAPMAAKCIAPSVLQVANGNSMAFSVTVTTSGSGAMIPVSHWPSVSPFADWRLLSLFVMCLLLLLAPGRRTLRENFGPAPRWALGGLLTTVVLLAAYGSAGCGGGGSASSALVQTPTPTPTPTPTVTPTGTSTLTLTMTVSTVGGTQLAPPPPVSLTLTVK